MRRMLVKRLHKIATSSKVDYSERNFCRNQMSFVKVAINRFIDRAIATGD